MKILAFTDTHEQMEDMETIRRKAKDVDLLMCAGDFTMFGSGMKSVLEFFDSINKPMILTHGNHEDRRRTKRMCEQTKNIKFFHNEIVEIENLSILCHGGGGFTSRRYKFDQNIPKFVKQLKDKKRVIFMTHAPPYGIVLDEIYHGNHVGTKSYREFIEQAQPTVAICGHIHNAFKKKDKIGKTLCLNPGPKGIIINI